MSKHKTKPEQTIEGLLADIKELKQSVVEANAERMEAEETLELRCQDLLALRRQHEEGAAIGRHITRLVKVLLHAVAVLAATCNIDAAKELGQ